MQDYAEGTPSPALAAHVLCWSMHRIDAGSSPYLHRSAPSGSVEIVCEVGGQSLVVGPQTEPFVRTLSPGAAVASLRLRPESAAVLGVPAYELADQIVSLEDVLPAMRFLRERIAIEPELAVEALESAVSAQLARYATTDRLVAFGVRQLTARASRQPSAFHRRRWSACCASSASSPSSTRAAGACSASREPRSCWGTRIRLT
jgi:hypothetical protein